MKNEKKNNYKIYIVFSIILITICIGYALYNTTSDYIISDIDYKKHLNRDISYSTGLFNKDQTANNVYMDYLYKDNIGLKINNIFLSKNELKVIIDFSFSNNLYTNELTYSYIVYDNHNRILASRLVQNYSQYLIAFYKEKNVAYEDTSSNMLEGFGHEGFAEISTDTQHIKEIYFKSDKLQELPISSIFVRVFDISYQATSDSQINPGKRIYLVDTEWDIQVDI